MAGPAGLTTENLYGHYAASAAQLGGDPTALYPTMVSDFPTFSYFEKKTLKVSLENKDEKMYPTSHSIVDLIQKPLECIMTVECFSMY